MDSRPDQVSTRDYVCGERYTGPPAPRTEALTARRFSVEWRTRLIVRLAGSHYPGANRGRAARQSSPHLEVHIAGQGPAGRGHHHRAGGRAARYGGLDIVSRDELECSRRAVKGNAGGAGHFEAQDSDGWSRRQRGADTSVLLVVTVLQTKSNRRRLAQRRTCCYIGSC
jgi:hypothetical protein